MNDWASLNIGYAVVSPLYKPEYLPRYATSGAAGMDLHACVEAPVRIEPLQRVRIPTGIALSFPGPSVVGLVYARSGLAWRHGIALPNGVGVIDSDYTGEIQVLLTNFGDEPFTIQPGDRIAQIVFAPVHQAQLVHTEAVPDTERGANGFGSTGVSPVQR
ncbi:deoxyuridine 5'-triphosphate nucleotidohydrolase [Alicyclobacillus contaminans]|uniref:dUTP diphosphatase n=1 Tax=Alicyclobacillus contaminans TaxID=392016 RepID=UPI00040F9A70|nr:dUTP diphosphatase [Alicyclobacillus contaminans]GMA48981.1 deoxyuridine 5'-triphosphate nucleotidohydrolase [Alicyclobacillus contaminans]